jgi:hypothetical protein
MLQTGTGTNVMGSHSSFVDLQQVCYFSMVVAIHNVKQEHVFVNRLYLLDQLQNFVCGDLAYHVFFKFGIRRIFQRNNILTMLFMFAVVTDRRIHHNRSQPGFERMVTIIFFQIVKHLQKPLIQYLLSFLGCSCVAKADAFRISEKLFIKMPLSLVITCNASSNDCIEVVLVKGYFSSKKQSQGIKLSGIEFLTFEYVPGRHSVAKKYEKF